MKQFFTSLKASQGMGILVLSGLAFFQFWMLVKSGTTSYFAGIEAVYTWGFLLLAGLILFRIQNAYHPKHPLVAVNIGIAVALTGLYLGGLQVVFFQVLEVKSTYFSQFPAGIFIRGLLFVLVLLCMLYQVWITKNQLETEKRTQQLLETERNLNQAILDNLQQQLKPHFLFNSLNSISALTTIEPSEAQRMIHLLADFLRDTMQIEHQKTRSLAAELKQIELYLEIEKIRFGHRLQVEYDIESGCELHHVPVLILQPLVENAIKHGLYATTEALVIRIRVQKNGNRLEVTVENPVEKEAISSKSGTGFGLSSLQRKLAILYGQTDVIQTERTDENFRVTLKLPISEINLL